MGRSVFETILGAVVLALALLFLGFAYSSADLQKVKGYIVSANFPKIDGLKEGIDVKINGVKVGSVESVRLITDPGPNQYLVRVRMTIDPAVRLPEDTIAMIATESLLGGKYMSLVIGTDDDDLIKNDGTGRITRTQPPMLLDDLIGQLIYGNKRDTSAPAAPPSSSSPAPTSSAPAPGAAKPAAAPAEPAHP